MQDNVVRILNLEIVTYYKYPIYYNYIPFFPWIFKIAIIRSKSCMRKRLRTIPRKVVHRLGSGVYILVHVALASGYQQFLKFDDIM